MIHAMAAIIAVLSLSLAAVNAQPPNPHIVFIMADDLGFNDVTYHGNGEIPTPNIDDLANNGVKLENYYVAPGCGPTRAQFLTGKYTIHLGLHDSNLDTCTVDAIPADDLTIADALKEQGYNTHMIGKWHAGFHTNAHIPTSQGFDTFRGFLLSHGDHFKHTVSFGKPKVDYVDYHNNTEPYEGDEDVYSTTAFTNRAVELIGTHHTDKSMFMYLSYQAPHNPLEYPDDYPLNNNIKNRNRKKYAAMVEIIDTSIKRVTDALKAAGMYNDTVIIFSSDNGGSNNNGASSYPLKGQKGSYYQGGIRAVGFVSSPLIDSSQRGKEVKDLIHVTDWLPTVLGIAGSSVDSSLNLDGYDQWGTIKSGAPTTRTEALLSISKTNRRNSNNFNEKTSAALIVGDWKILTGNQHSYYSYPNPKDDYDLWKTAIANRGQTTTTKLFNLANDPYEDEDLSVINESKKNEMLLILRAYQKTMLDPIDDMKDLVACDPANRAENPGFWGPWM